MVARGWFQNEDKAGGSDFSGGNQVTVADRWLLLDACSNGVMGSGRLKMLL